MSKRRSKKYQQSLKLKEPDKEYELTSAIELAKEASYVKFDASIELHLNLNLDPRKSEQRLNTTTTLPYSTGKSKKILVIAQGETAKKAEAAGADLVEDPKVLSKIEKGWLDFDVVITTPELMPEIAKVAKILGPKGLMPNPKTGTVTNEIEKAIKQQRQGLIHLRTDAEPIIHLSLGKVSQDTQEIVANANQVIKAVNAAKPAKTKGRFIKSAYVSPTMGPSFRLNLGG